MSVICDTASANQDSAAAREPGMRLKAVSVIFLYAQLQARIVAAPREQCLSGERLGETRAARETAAYGSDCPDDAFDRRRGFVAARRLGGGALDVVERNYDKRDAD
jgi:hypothetical protein